MNKKIIDADVLAISASSHDYEQTMTDISDERLQELLDASTDPQGGPFLSEVELMARELQRRRAGAGEPRCNCFDQRYTRPWVCPVHGSVDGSHLDDIRAHPPADADRRDAERTLKIAEAAIDLFLEYRDKHGRDEDGAKACALVEFMDAEHYDSDAAKTGERG